MVSIREDKSDAMKLSPSECRLFYKLHPALMCYANWKQKILPDQPGDPAQFYALDPEKRVKVRDALNAQPDLIDQFVDVNPFSFKPDELEVVQSWKHALVETVATLLRIDRDTVSVLCYFSRAIFVKEDDHVGTGRIRCGSD
jgi:hypothetical protein